MAAPERRGFRRKRRDYSGAQVTKQVLTRASHPGLKIVFVSLLKYMCKNESLHSYLGVVIALEAIVYRTLLPRSRWLPYWRNCNIQPISIDLASLPIRLCKFMAPEP